MAGRKFFRIIGAAALLWLVPAGAHAQQALDEADPSILQKELRDSAHPKALSARAPLLAPDAKSDVELGDTITVGAIRVDGATELPSAAFAPVINAYVGRQLSTADLRELATGIANVARAAGYGLATAWIPQQRIVNGVLRVNLEEGRIDAIEAQGNAEIVVERVLAPLADGRPVLTKRLERQLLLAGDVAGVSLGRARLERRGGRNILVVKTLREHVQGRAWLDNWGTGSVGPIRARALVDVNGLAADDDSLTFGGMVTPLQPGEFDLAQIGYTKPIGANGTEFAAQAYYALSQAGGALKGRDIDGQSLDLELSVTHPLLRTRKASIWADIRADLRDASQTVRDVKVRDDRIVLLSTGLYTVADLSGGRIRARIDLSRGLGVLDATRKGDPLASRADGSAIFSKAEYWAQYDRKLGHGFSLQVASEGQIASRPLLSSEEMGLGGRYFLRGYDYREFSGDKGIAGSAELRFDLKTVPKPLKAAQLYVYGDAGSVGNYRNGGGGGSLASAGGGARFRIGDVEAGIELGVPLSPGFSGKTPDPRFSFTLAARF